MTDPESYRPYVGTVHFPRTTADLTSTTQCPACFTPLRSTVCSSCALDLNHPAAFELATLSADIAADLDRRLELIGRMRYETAQRAAGQAARSTPTAGEAPAAAPAAAAASVAAPPTVPAPPVPPAPPVAPAAAPAEPAAPRRHLGAQVILVIVAISILAIGAIGFLVFAFVNYGIVVRSAIIAGVTVAAFVAASLLRWRKLTASAEGVAALAVVLVYLDAWAIRANDFFGAGNANEQIYWGIVLIVSAAGFLLWHRATGLRVASIAGFGALAPGVALLAAGAGERLEDGTRVWLGLTGLAIGALVHALVPLLAKGRRIEQFVAIGFGLVGLGGALFSFPFAQRSNDWFPFLAGLVVAVVALLHVIVLLRTGSRPVFPRIVASIGTVAAASALAATAWRTSDATFALLAPALSTAVVALVLEFLSRRIPAAGTTVVAAWTGAVMVALALVFPLIITTGHTLAVLGASLTQRPLSGGLEEDRVAAVAAIAAVTVLAAGVWALTGRLVPRAVPIAASVAVAAILGVALLPAPWLVMAGWYVIAAAGIVALILTKRAVLSVRLGLRIVLAVAFGVSLLFGWIAGWAGWGTDAPTWQVAAVVAIALLLVARLALVDAAARAWLLVAAIAVATIGVAALGLDLGEPIDAIRFITALGVVVLAISAVLPERLLTTADRRATYWTALPVAATSALVGWLVLFLAREAGGLFAEPGASLILGLALVAALLLWTAVPATKPFGAERTVAAVVVGPAVGWVADSVVRLGPDQELLVGLAPVASMLIVAAGALVASILRPAVRRAPFEGGAAAMGTIGVIASATRDADLTWLVLLLAGVATLLIAVSRGGLFAAPGMRKHFGWVALGLATFGLWWRLRDDAVTDLEPYVLPLAGALLLVGLLAWRSARTRATDPDAAADGAAPPASPNRAPAGLLLGGLLTGILPLAALGVDGDVLRPIVVVAVSAALLLLGSLLRAPAPTRWYLDAIALAGGLGVVVGAIGRALGMVSRRELSDPALDTWVLVAAIVLLAAAFGQALPRTDDDRGIRPIGSQALGIVALAGILVVECLAFGDSRLGEIRALVTVLLFAAVHVISVAVDRAPFTRLIGWIAIGFGAVAAIAALAMGRLDPVELGSVPLGAALLAGGVIAMTRNPDARSWPHLGPGIVVLLLPSLIATYTEDDLWRLIALGVVTIAIVLVGALRRLQAPLILGAVYLLAHAIHTFSPQIRAIYEVTPWWVWLIVGGLIILVVAIRLERSIRDLRTFAGRIGNLR